MTVWDTPLEGVKLVGLEYHRDDRGFFLEAFSAERFKAAGLVSEFVQDNHSFSSRGVVRGLHFQRGVGQTKLVRTIRGTTWNVVVDIRPGSKTLGQWWGLSMTEGGTVCLYVPPGFANSFCALTDSDVMYKVSSGYAPELDGGIHYLDPDIGIPWPVSNPIVSKKDAGLGSFRAYLDGAGCFLGG